MKKIQDDKKKKTLFTIFSILGIVTIPILTSFTTLWVLDSTNVISDSINQPNLNEPVDNNNQFTAKIIDDILKKNGDGSIRASDLTKLAGIPDNAFTPEIKSQIKSIELSNNIKTIGPNILKNIPNLTHLDMSKSRLDTEFTVNSFEGSTEKLVTLKFPSLTGSITQAFVPVGSTIIFPVLVELDFPYKWVPPGTTTDYIRFSATFPNVKRIVVPQDAKLVVESIWPITDTSPTIIYIN